jgi:hypothetical protein
MTPADFRVYDVLNCCATAVSEAAAGRFPLAEAAHLEAQFAASGLPGPGSPVHAAVSVILEASDPSGYLSGRTLWNALDAASIAALAVMDGGECGLAALADAEAAAAPLPAAWRDAVTALLASAVTPEGAVT